MIILNCIWICQRSFSSVRHPALQFIPPSFHQNLQSFSKPSPGSGLVYDWVLFRCCWSVRVRARAPGSTTSTTRTSRTQGPNHPGPGSRQGTRTSRTPGGHHGPRTKGSRPGTSRRRPPLYQSSNRLMSKGRQNKIPLLLNFIVFVLTIPCKDKIFHKLCLEFNVIY